MRVLIIGGGAAGMTAAIAAARRSAQVTVLEQERQTGKKLLATGNGHCNLSNLDQEQRHYHCRDAAFAAQCLSAFDLEHTLQFWSGLGVPVREKHGGYLYPRSDQAASVAAALRMEAESLGVKLKLNTPVLGARKEKDSFLVETPGWIYEGDTLILAAGSRASVKPGEGKDGYTLAGSFGHSIREPLPALVPLTSKDPCFAGLAGVRAEAEVRLEISPEINADSDKVSNNGQNKNRSKNQDKNQDKNRNQDWGANQGWDTNQDWDANQNKDWDRNGDAENFGLPAVERGEVQLTKNGISGIPVFQLSWRAAEALRRGAGVRAVLDWMPEKSAGEVEALLREQLRLQPWKKAGQLLNGFFPDKLIICLLKRAGIGEKEGSLRARALEALVRQIKQFTVKIDGTGSFAQAQICAGGVEVSEVMPVRMESRLTRGLYLAGELLDVNGDCGGYNLQWAWTSGYLAGSAAAGGSVAVGGSAAVDGSAIADESVVAAGDASVDGSAIADESAAGVRNTAAGKSAAVGSCGGEERNTEQ